MGKRITIDDDIHKMLCSLKEHGEKSLSDVVRRLICPPAETAGELLDFHENQPAPKLIPGWLEQIRAQRGRRSPRPAFGLVPKQKII